MAASFIEINTSQRLGAEARRAIDLLREARDRLRRVTSVMATQIDGSDFSLMEEKFGLPVGAGPIVKKLLDDAANSLGTDTIELLVTQIG